MQERKFKAMLARLGDLRPRQRRAVVETLKGWMRRFRGVATKYLPNYLG